MEGKIFADNTEPPEILTVVYRDVVFKLQRVVYHEFDLSKFVFLKAGTMPVAGSWLGSYEFAS